MYIYSLGTTGRFKEFPNAKEWGNKTDEDKLQYKYFKALEEVCKAVEEHIHDTLRVSPTLQLIAQEQLSKCKQVVLECLEFLGDNYTRMMDAFDLASDAWDLGCFGITQLFLNDFSVPLACIYFVDFSVARSTLVIVLWTNLRIGIIADTFNKNGIQNHLAMSTVQVRFIIQQAKSSKKSSSAADVESLKVQIKSLQELVRKQETMLEHHRGKLEQIESRADLACATLELPLDSKNQHGKKAEKAAD